MDQRIDRVLLRIGLDSDAAELADFAARTFAATFADDNETANLRAHLASAFGIAQQTRELQDPNTVTVLAYLDGSLVAYAQVMRGVPPPCVTDQDAIELHRFYVDRSMHGRGVAQRLMNEVRRRAHLLGGRTLWLGVWERNPRAIAFYAKCGFEDCGSHTFQLGSDRQIDRVLVGTMDAD